MKLDPNEQRLGYFWFASAGTFAVLLSIALYCTNNRLHASHGEKDEGNTLKQLRTAQFSLPSRANDSRQNQPADSGLRAVTNAERQEIGHE